MAEPKGANRQTMEVSERLALVTIAMPAPVARSA